MGSVMEYNSQKAVWDVSSSPRYILFTITKSLIRQQKRTILKNNKVKRVQNTLNF